MKGKIIVVIVMFILISAVAIIGTVHSGANKTAEKYLEENKKVQVLLGSPVRVSSKWFDGSYVEESKINGRAKLGFNVSGSKDNGSAIIVLHKNTSWHIRDATLFLNHDQKTVFLIKNSVEINNVSESAESK